MKKVLISLSNKPFNQFLINAHLFLFTFLTIPSFRPRPAREGVERDGAVKTTKRGDKFGMALSANKLLLLSVAGCQSYCCYCRLSWLSDRRSSAPSCERLGVYQIQTTEPNWRQSGYFQTVFTDLFRCFFAPPFDDGEDRRWPNP